MIFGMTVAEFTLLHVLISLIGIGSGLVVVYGLLTSRVFNRWTALFLISTVLTSVTGFGFPFEHLLPSHIIGILSLLVLAIVIAARYLFHLRGAWRWIYAVGSVLALYLNVFVLIVQLFRKVPVLNVLAPTQSEPPFFIAQALVLCLFVVIGLVATKRFRNDAVRIA
jgi:hypothetical protein